MFPIFLYHELRSYIVLESIRYAQPNNNQDFSIGQDELRTFVGIIFSLDTIAFQLNECIGKDLRMSKFVVCIRLWVETDMSTVEIKRYFHLANNEELDANREEKGQSFVQPD